MTHVSSQTSAFLPLLICHMVPLLTIVEEMIDIIQDTIEDTDYDHRPIDSVNPRLIR